jgi:chemotaxis protein CheX
LEPFIAAVCQALGEMASTQVVVRALYQRTLDNPLGDLSAVLALRSANVEALVLSFPERTAAALCRRILAEANQEVDESLIRDCAGEIANVVAGQAEAMLAETPYPFAFSVPQVLAGSSPELQPKQDRDCVVVAFSSDLGEFAMQLYLKR